MPPSLHVRFLILALGALFLPAALVFCTFPVTLTLERAFPVKQGVQLAELRARDRARHRRILQTVGGVVDFHVHGTYNPMTVGLYFTTVKLGSPPKEFNVQLDTGSDILWVACNPCDDCPTSSGLDIQLNSFDPATSTTASVIPCSSNTCSLAVEETTTDCSSDGSHCSYSFHYGDGSGTSGYYVMDTFYFNTVFHSSISNSSASIIFGCSNHQSADLTKTDRAVDGIFGFGKSKFSVASQLSSRGIAPKIFSHCLSGSNAGGGIWVLGEIVAPNIVYTPLVPSQPHYNVNLQSIAVNGQILPIDPAVFATSSNQGTIIDSGTTLAYLAGGAYDPFVSAISNTVSQSVRRLYFKGTPCYLISSSVEEIFPVVTFNFEGGATMVLKPVEYLVQEGYVDGTESWCIGFQRPLDMPMTILGDLVLRDKIFIYDLVNQRIGWTDYDCEFVNAGQLSVSGSSQNVHHVLIPASFVAFLVHIWLLGEFLFL
ncbi:aspartic proteinase 36 isoform X2 [Macadamia integrifolia]|uniref:aspartic proteinase 36 isoform X2 n=1 Tax=Macadamia integrifolia TaxID=60698 RepID=UPI001C4EE8A8|nr:aspartic proteinase 36 isoform X2 [Macadamia integrifolia]